MWDLSTRFRQHFFILLLLSLGSHFSLAQILPKEDDNSGLEELYDKYDSEETSKKRDAPEKREDIEDKSILQKDLSKLSELEKLSAFENIGVIQKRYLPKTSRFEFSTSGMFTTNNAFFNNLGLSLQAGYHVTDRWAVEGTYAHLFSDERPITEGLVSNQSIETRALVQPESYMAVNIKWTPTYGKIAWFQQKIIPFDFYVSPGIGMTTTDAGSSELTFLLGIGQLYAISKSFGVRWDFTWNNYTADIELANGDKSTQSHNDLILSVGVSFFFPEASYR